MRNNKKNNPCNTVAFSTARVYNNANGYIRSVVLASCRSGRISSPATRKRIARTGVSYSLSTNTRAYINAYTRTCCAYTVISIRTLTPCARAYVGLGSVTTMLMEISVYPFDYEYVVVVPFRGRAQARANLARILVWVIMIMRNPCVTPTRH